MFSLVRFPKLLTAGFRAKRALSDMTKMRPERAVRADMIYAEVFSKDPVMWPEIMRQKRQSSANENEIALVIVFSAILFLLTLISFLVYLNLGAEDNFPPLLRNLWLLSAIPLLLTQWRFYARRWVGRNFHTFPSLEAYANAPQEIRDAFKVRGIEHALTDMSISLGPERAAKVLALLRSGEFDTPDGSEIVGEALEALSLLNKVKPKTISAG